ncbi:hypothetical protein AAF712_015333, partial [Marasmius tenuissimus]
MSNPATLANGHILLLMTITIQELAFSLLCMIKNIYPNKTVVEQQLQTIPTHTPE